MKPDKLELLEAGLGSREQEAAAGIVARYGRDALATRVLPANGPVACKRRFAMARVKQLAKPRFPLGAAAVSQDGIVVVQFTVGTDGLARDPEVLAAAPLKTFDEAAIDTVLESRFHPALLEGKPIEARHQIRITFFTTEGGTLWNVDVVKKLRERAETGDRSAEYLVGLLGTLDPTLKIPIDDARAMMLRAAQSGQPAAQYLIGRRMTTDTYCSGVDKTRPWFEAARSELGSARIALAEQLLAQPDATSHLDEIGGLLHDATQAKDGYSLKHAVALLSVPPHASLGDPAAALAAAKRLEDLSVDYDPQVQEAIAAAYAANGDFAHALEQQRDAVEQAHDLYWNTSAMQARQAAYEQKKIWSGDLLAVPPATGPIPEVTNEARRCSRGAERCQRTPDKAHTPTGTHITR